MKKELRISCILLLTVLILTANTVFSAAETGDEAVDIREVLSVQDEKHADYTDRLIDGVYGTRVSYASGETVGVYSSLEIGYAYIAWQEMPGKVSLAWVDRDRKTISSEERVPTQLDECIPVPQEGICGFTLTFKQACSISELSAYTPGNLPAVLPRFEEPLKDAAVMVVTGYPGDELVCFGGLLPTLIDQGVPMQMVYLNPYNRTRQEECLRTLWKLGMRNAPIFLNTTGRRSLDAEVWKSNMEHNGDVSKELMKVLESYHPSVVVTHGKNRPFPLMAEADATYSVMNGIYDRIKKSPWLKKIYYVMESGAKNAETFDFSAGYEKAATLYKEGYTSMATFHYTPYSDDTYLLYHVTSNKYKTGQMLDNITYTPLSTPTPESTATPEPTAEPTPEPTATPTVEPTPEPTEEPTPEPTKESVFTEAPVAVAAVVPTTPVPTPMPRQADAGSVWMPILLSLALALVLFGALLLVKKMISTPLPVAVAILVPLLAGAVLCVGLYKAASLNKEQAARADAFDALLAEAAARTPEPTFTPEPTAAPTLAPTAELTPVPTAEPTLEPTEAPTPAPTAEPTATPDPDAGFYTDGEEIVEADAENGKWIYKNSTVSIEITQYTGKAMKMDFPYYVADIHMRADEFRAGFGHEGRSGTGKDSAMNIAKRYRAVMMVTGDNLIHMDKDKKGVMIRDGWVYQSTKKGDLMVWHPESLSIELIPKEKVTNAQLIQEDGVENCISFGPILIQDGVKTGSKTLENNWLYKTNPRVGVGMVSPGHFIVIVGGYRSDNPKANLGWNLNEFADLMESYGCTQAYNMDGGVSACLVFMGERLNRGGNKKDWSQLRTLPDGLLFGYSETVKK